MGIILSYRWKNLRLRETKELAQDAPTENRRRATGIGLVGLLKFLSGRSLLSSPCSEGFLSCLITTNDNVNEKTDFTDY